MPGLAPRKYIEKKAGWGELSVKIIWAQASKSKFLLVFNSTPHELGDQLTQ